jgi:hypothetical protein
MLPMSWQIAFATPGDGSLGGGVANSGKGPWIVEIAAARGSIGAAHLRRPAADTDSIT